MAKTDLTKSQIERFDRIKEKRNKRETKWKEVEDNMQTRKDDDEQTREKGERSKE